MTSSIPNRKVVTSCFASLAILLATALAGCATQTGTSEDKVGRFLAAPGKYEFYTCPQLAAAGKPLVTRERELSDLIVKAGDGAGGSFVSAFAYRPEYYQVRGNISELRSAATAKNCNLARDEGGGPPSPAR